jgi:hypothetical protein
LFCSIALLFIAFYSTLGNWMAGRAWGSRYLVVIVPYLMVGWAILLARMTRGVRAFAMVLVTTVGVLVQLPGVVVDYAKVSQAQPVAATTAARQWDWAASPLVLNTRAMATAVPQNFAYVTGLSPVPRIARTAGAEDRTFSQQFAFSLDFWWLYLFYLGVLPAAGVAIAMAAFATWTFICARGLGRELA